MRVIGEESPAINILRKALLQVRGKPEYTLIVKVRNEEGQELEIHIKALNITELRANIEKVSIYEYTVTIYESMDQMPFEEVMFYNQILEEFANYYFKSIYASNDNDENKGIKLYTEPQNPQQLKILGPTDKGFFKLKYNFDPNEKKAVALTIEPSSYPGECVICGEGNVAGGFCRVNCAARHIFHCKCINQWRNTPQVNPFFEHGWQNNCPICRDPITKMIELKLPSNLLPQRPSMEFGNRILKVKLIRLIKYLQR